MKNDHSFNLLAAVIIAGVIAALFTGNAPAAAASPSAQPAPLISPN